MNAPKLRFKEFNDEIKIYNFNDVADYKKGPFGSSLKKSMFVPKSAESIKIYEQQNAIKKDWKLSRYFITKNYANKLKGFEVGPNDIIVSCAGTIGESYILPSDAEKGIINQALMRIRVKNIINQKYFLYVFDNMITNFSKTFSNGSAIKNIPPFADLKKQLLNLPSLEEQNKISKFISLLDKKIELQSKKIEALKLYKKGLYKLYFSNNSKKCREIPLKNICEITTGKLDANAMVENGKYRFYTCAKNYFYINEYAFDTEALLISGNGAYVGYIHYYKGKFNAYQRTYVLTNFKYNIKYIKCYLDCFLSKRINSEKKEGNTPYIVMGTLSKMSIKLPSEENQERISNNFDLLTDKINLEEIKLDKLESLKKGLMQNMFV